MKAKKVKEAVQKTEKPSTKESYTVITPFRDTNDFDKRYGKGDDVSHFDQERLDKLVGMGLVKSSLK